MPPANHRVTSESILWRRLDVPGHDACRLEESAAGWTIDGTAVLSEDGVPALLAYQIACDPTWRAQHGRIQGWIGVRRIEVTINRTAAGLWTLDGRPVPNVEHCVDLDLAFTPATNLTQLRRLALAKGQATEAPVARFDVSSGTLEVLSQRYERRDEASYWYEAPRFGYAALLEVTPTGFIRRYPGLWEAEL
jgi:uncharacterized protein